MAGAATYPLVDGGVFAANPAMCAWTDLIRAGVAPDVTVLASLGTGTAIRPIPFDDARRWGLLGWARPLIDVLFSGASETVGFRMGHLLGARYIRLPQRLEFAPDDIDDASPRTCASCARRPICSVRENTEAIDDLCARLTE